MAAPYAPKIELIDAFAHVLDIAVPLWGQQVSLPLEDTVAQWMPPYFKAHGPDGFTLDEILAVMAWVICGDTPTPSWKFRPGGPAIICDLLKPYFHPTGWPKYFDKKTPAWVVPPYMAAQFDPPVHLGPGEKLIQKDDGFFIKVHADGTEEWVVPALSEGGELLPLGQKVNASVLSQQSCRIQKLEQQLEALTGVCEALQTQFESLNHEIELLYQHVDASGGGGASSGDYGGGGGGAGTPAWLKQPPITEAMQIAAAKSLKPKPTITQAMLDKVVKSLESLEPKKP